MQNEYVAAGAAAVIVAVAAGILVGEVIVDRQASTRDAIGQPGSTHLHASFAVTVNGSEKGLGGPYIERAARAHLHDTDNVLHVHAENVDLDYALRTLAIGVNQSCLQFTPENETVCGGQAGIRVNGEQVAVEDALDRDIRQGDSIVVWVGDPPEGLDLELPPAYQESVPGQSV